MRVAFVKLNDRRHRVVVTRDDGSEERTELDSKDFLRHDLAHFAVEVELALEHGVWGSVASGGSLSGEGLDGPDMALAEALAGPMQTLMRTAAGADEILGLLDRVAPAHATREQAERLHRRGRALMGQWAATGYGEAMELAWP